MPTTGYSGTPLQKKLGLREDHRVWLIDPPDDYFGWLEMDISAQIVSAREVPDWAHLFAVSGAAFLRGMKSLTAAAKKNTGLIIWVSWYKKSSGMRTDLTEDTIRGYALHNGLVDIKVCAVSEQWSGLKLVVPLKSR